ncbi:MAG: segregation/condensation protein A [Clostridiales bacterium]|nr:segregation/condensation protein A [Clostridiales bacterium]
MDNISTAYNVKLNVFEGPLDLLLHLINKAKVDIKDISVANITSQYLEYLEDMKKIDMDIASEFLVMASTLLYIKSCSLVPDREDHDDETEHGAIVSEEDLIQRLVEYKRYKKMAEELKCRENLYSGAYNKVPESILIEGLEKGPIYHLTREDLLNAINKIVSIERVKNRKQEDHVISISRITIGERIQELRRLINDRRRLNFADILHHNYDRMHIITTFLALLEMIKNRQIILYQKDLFGDILIEKRG